MSGPDRDTVIRIARAALGDPNALVGESKYEPLGWQSIAPTTAELSRLSGFAPDGQAWSAIHKVLRRPGPGWNADWRREAEVYRSGVLDDLPPGIVAPRVYAIEERGDDEVGLWLEEVVETVGDWPISRYAAATRDLGRFNGAYLAGRPFPIAPALRTGWLATWVGMTGSKTLEILADPTITEHELASRAVPRALHERLRALHAAREQLLEALDALPQTVSHLDAWRANLIARDTPGRTETVAIDWSLLGLAPVGQELAIFVTGERVWLGLEGEKAEAVEAASYAAYLDGLREAGWTGREDELRFAYAASMALWAGIPGPAWMRWFSTPERQEWLSRKFGRPIAEATAPFAAFIETALDRADEVLATLC